MTYKERLYPTTLQLPKSTQQWLKKIGGKQGMSEGIRKLHNAFRKITYPVGRPKKNCPNTNKKTP